MINNGSFETLLASKHIPVEKINDIKNSIANVNFSNVAIGIYERSMALILQVGMSMMVFYGVVTRKYKYYLFAVLFHIAADFSAALAQKGVISPAWIVEIILIPFAIAAWLIARNLFIKLKALQPTEPVLTPLSNMEE
jgi:uncharacterized membrane protein YhfC